MIHLQMEFQKIQIAEVSYRVAILDLMKSERVEGSRGWQRVLKRDSADVFAQARQVIQCHLIVADLRACMPKEHPHHAAVISPETHGGQCLYLRVVSCIVIDLPQNGPVMSGIKITGV